MVIKLGRVKLRRKRNVMTEAGKVFVGSLRKWKIDENVSPSMVGKKSSLGS